MHSSRLEYPPPPWAVGPAKSYESIGARLFTRDGRKLGNGVVIQVHGAWAHIALDNGNLIIIGTKKLPEYFHSPIWLMDPKKAPGLRSELNDK